MQKAKGFAGVNKLYTKTFFNGGEIWIEHLDGIYEYTNLAIEKFQNDYKQLKRPSMSSLIAINHDETAFDAGLMNVIVETS
ncbi:hypothetical protein [Cuneatibacter caecimuris]|uniref:Uncharacterized protein n=1 Tax=Cuneatibacter caecimuris TaxID=1796618 RepID=A0A4Q7PM56_9FIRM|nr:hypothetical protein [Cuneatibacter caecimuris]RZT02011.1 hypothetical protein EV209_0113 [Cuneatibacter caecimuris]